MENKAKYYKPNIFKGVVLGIIILFTSIIFGNSIIKAAVSNDERHIIISYTRSAKDYKSTTYNWNFWVWEYENSGNIVNKREVTGTVKDGKLIADVKVSSKTTKLGYIIRKSTTTNSWAEKDVESDRFVDIPLNQNIVKLNVSQGSEHTIDAPYNIGYEETQVKGKIIFYYRDDNKYYSDTLQSLSGKVYVEVDGNRIQMEYNSANKRFNGTITGLTEGKHYYRYIVDGKSVIDEFNANTTELYNGKTCSWINYENPTLEVNISPNNLTYNENAVISLTGKLSEKMNITSIYADLSSVGGNSRFEIDKELKSGTISVKDSVTEGIKNIPVTITEAGGKITKKTVSLTVKKREAASGDFDWDEAVIYFMVTDRFLDGNSGNNTANGKGLYDLSNPGSYHGGDFEGVTKKLDYLKQLGINTIWLTPIVDNVDSVPVDGNSVVKNYTSYHGYWARNFEKLNANLGTEAELRTLIEQAHNRGIKIMVDVVVNHGGYGSESNSAFSGMFRDATSTVAGSEIYSSISGLPDFKTEDAKVREQIIQWQTAWMEGFDIDYFRVDTVKHVDNTTWKAFKNSLTNANPSFKMIGEYWGASYSNKCNNLLTGTMDSLLDFGFKDYVNSIVKGNLENIEKTLEERNKSIDNTGTLGNFLSSHDEDGFYQKLKNSYDSNTAQAKMLVASTIQITAKGQPVIYYGEEIGMTGLNSYPTYSNRYDFDWSKANANNQIYNHYKKMLNIRKEYSKVLSKGDRNTVAADNTAGYLVFSRTYKDENVLVGINIKETDKTIKINVPWSGGTTLMDKYNNKAYKVSADKTVTVSIPKASNGGTIILTKYAGKFPYTLKFDTKVSGMTLENQLIYYNTPYGKLPTISRKGYTFTGWFTSGGTKVTETTVNKASSNRTLYAHWKAKRYTIKFNGNGGTVTIASKKITFNKSHGILPTPKRTGYTFKGWYTSKKGNTKIVSTTKVTYAGARTLYARWTKVTPPAQVNIKTTASNSKNKMTVSVYTVAGAAGYELKYSSSSNFKYSKEVRTTGKVFSINSLKSEKRYYCKIRAYKTDSKGKKIYGSYSKVKTVTIK